MQKRFDVTIAGEINLDLILYGLPEDMPVDRELLGNDFRRTILRLWVYRSDSSPGSAMTRWAALHSTG